MHGRVYYLAPAYPMLFAAGGVARGAASRKPSCRVAPARVRRAARRRRVSSSRPCPSRACRPKLYVRYSRALGMEPPRIETHRMGPLPQLLADRFGWKEMADKAAAIYHALPPEEQRAGARVFGQNYGQAGAIDMYGPGLGLPPALSGPPRVPRVGAAGRGPAGPDRLRRRSAAPRGALRIRRVRRSRGGHPRAARPRLPGPRLRPLRRQRPAGGPGTGLRPDRRLHAVRPVEDRLHRRAGPRGQRRSPAGPDRCRTAPGS